jgi:hypothetical protein
MQAGRDHINEHIEKSGSGLVENAENTMAKPVSVEWWDVIKWIK